MPTLRELELNQDAWRDDAPNKKVSRLLPVRPVRVVLRLNRVLIEDVAEVQCRAYLGRSIADSPGQSDINLIQEVSQS